VSRLLSNYSSLLATWRSIFIVKLLIEPRWKSVRALIEMLLRRIHLYFIYWISYAESAIEYKCVKWNSNRKYSARARDKVYFIILFLLFASNYFCKIALILLFLHYYRSFIMLLLAPLYFFRIFFDSSNYISTVWHVLMIHRDDLIIIVRIRSIPLFNRVIFVDSSLPIIELSCRDFIWAIAKVFTSKCFRIY